MHLSTYLSSTGQTDAEPEAVGGRSAALDVCARNARKILACVCFVFLCLQTVPVCKLFANCLFAKNPAPAGVCKQCLFANCLFVERIWQTDAILLLGMKVLFFPVDIVLLGYEGTLLSRGDIDMFCFVVVACFHGSYPAHTNEHSRSSTVRLGVGQTRAQVVTNHKRPSQRRSEHTTINLLS